MPYHFRCLSVGHLPILIYDQSHLAWKYCRKLRDWGFTHTSCEHACHLQFCTDEESCARNQTQDILLESCTGDWLEPDLAPDPLELCAASSVVYSLCYHCRSVLYSNSFCAKIHSIPRSWPQERKPGMGMGLCGWNVRHQRPSLLRQVFFKKRSSTKTLTIDWQQLLGKLRRCRTMLISALEFN